MPGVPTGGPLHRRAHLGIGQVIAAVADEGDIEDFLLKGGSARDVALGVGELEGGPIQCGKHRVCERGVEKLGVVDVQLVHPALHGGRGTWLVLAVLRNSAPLGAAS